MKHIYILFIVLINIFIVNAEINVLKSEYSGKETFQAELTFQNLVEDISSRDITILDSKNQSTDIGVLLVKIKDDAYFVYFDIPAGIEGNYSLQAETKYIENNELKKAISVKKFLIKNEQDNLISINPPYVVFEQEGKNFFRIDIKNKGNNQVNIKISEELNLTNIFNNNMIIAKGSENSFYFSVDEKNIKDRGKLSMKIAYNGKLFLLPIYLLKGNENLLFFTKAQEEKNYISSYNIEIPFGNYAESAFFVENNLGKNLTNLSVVLEGEITEIAKLGFYNLELSQNRAVQLNFFINQDRKARGDYRGKLIIRNSEIEAILPVSISIKQEIIENIEEPKEEIKENKTVENKSLAVKKERSISNKTLSYLSITFVFILFFIIYLIIYIRSSKQRHFRR